MTTRTHTAAQPFNNGRIEQAHIDAYEPFVEALTNLEPTTGLTATVMHASGETWVLTLNTYLGATVARISIDPFEDGPVHSVSAAIFSDGDTDPATGQQITADWDSDFLFDEDLSNADIAHAVMVAILYRLPEFNSPTLRDILTKAEMTVSPDGDTLRELTLPASADGSTGSEDARWVQVPFVFSGQYAEAVHEANSRFWESEFEGLDVALLARPVDGFLTSGLAVALDVPLAGELVERFEDEWVPLWQAALGGAPLYDVECLAEVESEWLVEAWEREYRGAVRECARVLAGSDAGLVDALLWDALMTSGVGVVFEPGVGAFLSSEDVERVAERAVALAG